MRTSLSRALARQATSASDAGLPPRRVAINFAAVLFVVGAIVLAAFWWWTSYHSARWGAARYLDAEVLRGRGCLLSRDWAHVDRETGLVVAKCESIIYCGDFPVEQSPVDMGDDDEFIDGWNDALRRHLDAGEACGPRFGDRVATLDALRDRFGRDAAAAMTLPSDGDVEVGDRVVRWYGSSVIVREKDATRWLQPAGGAPFELKLGHETIDVTALTADDGRSLWVRVAAKAGEDLRYLVADLATGTNFQVFDATSAP